MTIKRHGATAEYRAVSSGVIEAAYQKDSSDFERGTAILDTIAAFGIDITAMPEGDAWLKQLQLLERRGHIDLSAFDLDDPIDREFVFKRYVFMTTEDAVEVGKMMGAQRDDLKSALDLL